MMLTSKGATTGGVGGPDPTTFAWTPPTFWTKFSWFLSNLGAVRWFMTDNQFTYSYLTT